MAQYGRPRSDVAVNGWTYSTGTTLFGCVDEAFYSDTDYIDGNVLAYCEVALTNTLGDPNSSSGHILRYRYGRNPTNRSVTLVIRLMQGSTEIASWTHTNPAISFNTAEQTLTALQADAITDYTALSVRCDITAIQNSQAHAQVSCIELEIPNAASLASASKSAYLKGLVVATPSSIHAYSNASNPSYPASSSKVCYTRGSTSTAPEQRSAYTRGQIVATPSSKVAYARGGVVATPSSKIAYTKGIATGDSNQDAFIRGKLDASPSDVDAYTRGALLATPSAKSAYARGCSPAQENTPAYMQGSNSFVADIDAYLQGSSAGTSASDSQYAYLDGTSAGDSALDSNTAFTIGIDSILVPDGYVASTGTWQDETGGTSNLWTHIDETTINDSDYIWNVDPDASQYIEFTLSNPAGTPGTGKVVLFWRGKDKTGLGHVQATAQLRQGTDTVIASMQQVLTSTPRVYYLELTDGERANITDWSDLRFRIIYATV